MTPLHAFALGVVLLLPSGARAGEVRLAATDGQALVGAHFGTGEKGVLLVHDAGRSGGDWENFAARLADNGFSVLALDLRGHGSSKGELPAEDWSVMVGDVLAGAAWLSGKGASSVSVVGSGLGANLALNAAAQTEGIHNLVLLSPSLNDHEVKVSGAIGAWTGPLLLVADAKDPTGSRAATLLGDSSAGKARVDLLDAGTSGHRMLNTVPELEATLVGWLNGSRGEGADLARPDRTIGAGQVDSIETTGRTYGSEP